MLAAAAASATATAATAIGYIGIMEKKMETTIV